MSDPFETLKIFREPDGQYRIEANDGVLSIPASSIREAMGLATGYLESVDAAYRELMSNIETRHPSAASSMPQTRQSHPQKPEESR